VRGKSGTDAPRVRRPDLREVTSADLQPAPLDCARGQSDSASTARPVSFIARQWRIFTGHMEPAVFIPSAALVVGFVLFGAIFSGAARSTLVAMRGERQAHPEWKNARGRAMAE